MIDEPSANRRRCERSAFGRPVTLTVESDSNQSSYNVLAVDISPQGARLRTDVNLQAGQHVTVVRDQDFNQGIAGQVVWAGNQGTRLAGEVGIAFLKPIKLDA